jgi:hypothetical protein
MSDRQRHVVRILADAERGQLLFMPLTGGIDGNQAEAMRPT